MDLPSIKFRYYEKLKLWHDYLSPNSIFETKKIEYWKHEKIILLWAYSGEHQHLYSYFDSNRIREIYGIGKNNPEISIDKELVEDFKKDYNDRVYYLTGNLVIKGFAETIIENPGGYPEKIRITPKGLLLGEIISESKSNNFLKKNSMQYRIGYYLLVGIIIFSILLIVMTVFNQVV
ncbi:MAG TPA: hypothetical protein VJC13_01615 [Candidatus Paceibacterota bacterium]